MSRLASAMRRNGSSHEWLEMAKPAEPFAALPQVASVARVAAVKNPKLRGLQHIADPQRLVADQASAGRFPARPDILFVKKGIAAGSPRTWAGSDRDVLCFQLIVTTQTATSRRSRGRRPAFPAPRPRRYARFRPSVPGLQRKDPKGFFP